MNKISSMLFILGTIFLLLLVEALRNNFSPIVFLLAGIGLLMVAFLWIKVKQSLKNVGNAMSHSKPIESTFIKEIEPIVYYYHHLLKRESELLNELNEKKLKIVHIELNLSQSEMNPHFLYNTLDSIYWMAKKEDMTEISEMVLNLSSFFRLSLNRGPNTLPLIEEIQNLDYYLKIQQTRFMNRFTFYYEISEETKNIRILKKLIQPLIENSFIHGLERMPEEGSIWIRTNIQQEILYIEIEDNGIGMDTDRLAYVQANLQKVNHENIYSLNFHSSSKDVFGLRNVKARLLLYYGSKAQLMIDSVPFQGTKVTVKIPIESTVE